MSLLQVTDDEVQSRLRELKEKGLGLAVITYDSPAVMADFSRRRGITFPLLSDPGSQTIKAYGILNITVAEGTSHDGIPFPGTFLIDRAGKVSSRFFEEAYHHGVPHDIEALEESAFLLTIAWPGKG